jgi:hypothetical protein
MSCMCIHDTLCRVCAFMTHYVMNEHSWRLMSRLHIYDMLFRGWTIMTDKKNFRLAEAPEFVLRAH